uniref:Uncharacterized protein n=1 Tax=Leptobrachium leishanense TaxID=445787 RepID=A0A8C5PH86_9ANUR
MDISSTVTDALQRCSEIGNQSRHDNSAFYKAVSQHLSPIADAVKELEHLRRMTRELLEVETIETSKLRYKVLHLPGIITKEIEAGIAKARESNESELTQLQNELQDILLELENTAKKQAELEEINALLSSREKVLSDEYQQAVDLLNQQMSEKAGKSIFLNETHNKRKEAHEAVVEYEIQIEDLAEDMVKERQQFTEEMRYLNDEISKTRRKTELQELDNTEQKKHLNQLRSVSYSVQKKLKVEKEEIVSVNGNILLLKASHARLESKLEVQGILFVDLCDKRETLGNQMVKRKDDFSRESSSFNGKISELAEETNNAEMSRQTLTGKNHQLREEYQALKEGEEKECAKKKDTARKLENSRMSVNEKMELYGRLKMELKEMELETTKLAEVYRINTAQLARHVDEFTETLEIEKQKRIANQIKKDHVVQELELWKLSGETFMNEMKQRIENGQKRQLSLSEESNVLHTEIEHFKKLIATLKEDNTRTSEEYLNMEQSLTKEIEQLEKEVKNVNGLLEEKSEELARKIGLLDQTEDAHKQEQQKYEDLKMQAGVLKRKKKALETSIETIGKDIQTRTNLKENKKASLQSLRKSAFEKLQDELQHVTLIERDVYELNRKMELVVMENCRLQLCNAQFKEDIDKSVKEGRKHAQDIKQMAGELVSLLQHLKKGWEKDTFVCNDFWERDKETLDTIAELTEKLALREVKIGHLNGILQKEFYTLASLLENKTAKDTLQSMAD